MSALFVDYGQAAAGRERTAATAVAAALGIGLMTRTFEHSRTLEAGEHPGRNALLISMAVFELGAPGGVVGIGVHAGTRYYDCSTPFVQSMNRLVQEQTDGRTALTAPLVMWTKAEVFRVFQGSGVPLDVTYSCETGPTPCGVCLSCADRWALQC